MIRKKKSGKRSSSTSTALTEHPGRNKISSKSAHLNLNGGMPDSMSIQFDGKEINTIHDLISNFKLDNYEESKRKREQRVNDPDNPMPGNKDVDAAYLDMI